VCAERLANYCNLITAIFALAASIAWIAAAYHPVGVPGLSVRMPSDRNDPLWKKIESQGRKILRGAKLNFWAALLTGLSAGVQFLSWLLPKIACI
jgi:hypothetical protein